MSQLLTQKSSKIFISYRRDLHADAAGRLADNLITHFGTDQIFMDIDHIEPGEDFVQVIKDAVSSCQILIAIIGRGWLTSSEDGSARRLDNPNDFVRLEIATALSRNVRVIPVLIQGVTMPAPQDLPADLVQLSYRHAFELSYTRWKQDIGSLIKSLDRILEKQQQEVRRRVEEEARRKAEEEEGARKLTAEREAARLAEERTRAEAAQERQRAEEETRRREAEAEQKRLAEEAARLAAVEREREEETRRRQEEARGVEEERRKRAEEEKRQRRAAEEAKRRAAEEAARKLAAEQEAFRYRAEKERARAEEARQKAEGEARQRKKETARHSKLPKAISIESALRAFRRVDEWLEGNEGVEEESKRHEAAKHAAISQIQADQPAEARPAPVLVGRNRQGKLAAKVSGLASASSKSLSLSTSELIAMLVGFTLTIAFTVIGWGNRVAIDEEATNVNQPNNSYVSPALLEPSPTGTLSNSSASPSPATPSPTRTTNNLNINIPLPEPGSGSATINSNITPTSPEPSPTSTPGNPNSALLGKKNISPLRVIDTPEGSRVTVTTDAVLNDYSAYRSGDRFYVVIPDANAPRLLSKLRGRGFDDVKIERRGVSVVLSFRLQPGTSARVDQKYNRLEIIFYYSEHVR